MPYSPRTSGGLRGGGNKGNVQGFKRRRNVVRNFNLKHMPDVHLSDASAVKRMIPDFDPMLEEEYTEREKLLLAEKILLSDERPPYVEPVWLPLATYLNRYRREIYSSVGTPEPSIASGLYWRSHPDGRRVNSDEQRAKNGAGYYR